MSELSKVTKQFDYVPVNKGQNIRIEAVRAAVKNLVVVICDNCPESEMRDSAVLQLKLCSMTANSSIAHEDGS